MFRFGENWKRYIRKISKKHIEIAKKSLSEFYGLKTFEGKTLVDVGCGSGLFSYCAYQLGAKKIVSFDIDEDAVECCKILRERAGNPKNWIILHGDILDEKFVSNLGVFDLVYAWGVLHHTGSMYKAILNTMKLVAPNGLLYLAIYNKCTSGRYTSEDWLRIKQRYANANWFVKRLIELWYIAYWIAIRLKRGENPVSAILKYSEYNRGMTFYESVRDWLGGLPYEFATTDEIISFVEMNGPFKLIKVNPDGGTGCNEFLFKKNQA